MSGNTIDRLGGRVVDYRDNVEEQWKAEHRTAMQVLDLEVALMSGLQVYELINFIDEKTRIDVFSKEAEYSPEIDKAIGDAYSSWSGACEFLLEAIRDFENQSFVVDNAESFRSACREVKGILTDDSEFFSGDKFDRLTERALREYEQGKCTPFVE